MKIKYISILPVIAILALSSVLLTHAQTTGLSYTFTQNLTIGSTGSGVIALQQILINDSFLTSVSAPTGYFGYSTKAALAKFQAANGIYPTSGYCGSKSRAVLNALNDSPQSTTSPQNTSQAPVIIASPTISSPSISYINPSIVIEGNTNVLTIAGSGFQNGAGVMIGGAKLTATGSFSPNSISVNYLSPLPAGTYGVTVTNPDGGKYTLPNSFTVSQPQEISTPPTTNYSAPEPQQPTYTPQPASFQLNANYLNFDATAVNATAENLQVLEGQYAQDVAAIQSTPEDIEFQQGQQNNLNQVYNSQLSAAQLTLQNAQNQQKIDNAIQVASNIESQIESEQIQNEKCASVPLSLGGGSQGIAAQQNAMDCYISAQKESEDIQQEAMGY